VVEMIEAQTDITPDGTVIRLANEADVQIDRRDLEHFPASGYRVA